MKKLVNMIVVLAMVLGMGITTFAAGDWEIDSIYEEYYEDWGFCYFIPQLQQGNIPASEEQKYFDGGGTSLHLGTIEPGEELWFNLNGSPVFNWEGPDGEIYNQDNPDYQDEEGNWHWLPSLTSRYLRKAGMQFSVQAAQANRLIDGRQYRTENDDFNWMGELYTDEENIVIPFADKLVSTESIDFEFIFTFRLRGEPFTHRITVTGTLENPSTPVYEGHDYVDLSEGRVAEAQDHIERIECDLGLGVSVFTKMFKGKSFYGTASRDDDDKDDVVYKQYPDIDNILHLDIVGLNSTGDVVKLATDYAKYHVYDKDFNYLGTADQMLPFSTKYYLANKKLDIEDEDADDELEDEPVDDEPVDE